MAYAVPPTGQPEVALFYMSAAEGLGTAGTNIIGYDVAAPYNSPIITNNYTASPDQSTFVANVSGLFQMEAHVSVNPNGATWTNLQKQIYFQITRGATSNIATCVQSTQVSSGGFYTIALVATFPIQQGDQIQVVHSQSGVTGNPLARGLESGFDLNTWVSFTFVKNV